MIEKKAIARRYWSCMLRGSLPATFEESSIEEDGRKRKSAVKALVSEGVLTPVTLKTASGDAYERLQVNDEFAKGFAPAEKPDLVHLADIEVSSASQLHDAHGVSLDMLNIGQLRFVAEASTFGVVPKYRFFDAWNRPVVLRDHYEKTFVKDDAYEAAVTARRLALKVEEAQNMNLAWGLQKAGIIEPVDSDLFKCEMPGGWPGGGHNFTKDHNAWEGEAQKIVASLRERIARDTRKVNALLAADAKVKAGGGWAKFIETYKAQIEEEVTKKQK